MSRQVVLFACIALMLSACGKLASTPPGEPEREVKPVAAPLPEQLLREQGDELPGLFLDAPGLIVPDEPEINLFLTHYREHRHSLLTPALARRQKVISAVEEIFHAQGVPTELAELALLESGYRTSARSRRGAVGMWQFIPQTARRYGLVVKRGVDERRDLLKSTDAAARYLRDLYTMFGSWELALASFNAGEGAVIRAMQKSRSRDFFELARGGFLHRETREFVPRFFALALLARDVTVYDSVPMTEFALNETLEQSG
jgi:membrane-bound lytic murein transglycosylase D